MKPRVIITLNVLLDAFKAVPKSIVDHFIGIYAQEYSIALKMLDELHDKMVSTNSEAAGVWTDLKNALLKMSPVERNRLRRECQNYLESIMSPRLVVSMTTERTFKTYDDFLAFAYDPFSRDENGTWPRLREKFKFLIVDENTIYSSVMDCLHAHEES